MVLDVIELPISYGYNPYVDTSEMSFRIDYDYESILSIGRKVEWPADMEYSLYKVVALYNGLIHEYLCFAKDRMDIRTLRSTRYPKQGVEMLCLAVKVHEKIGVKTYHSLLNIQNVLYSISRDNILLQYKWQWVVNILADYALIEHDQPSLDEIDKVIKILNQDPSQIHQDNTTFEKAVDALDELESHYDKYEGSTYREDMQTAKSLIIPYLSNPARIPFTGAFDSTILFAMRSPLQYQGAFNSKVQLTTPQDLDEVAYGEAGWLIHPLHRLIKSIERVNALDFSVSYDAVNAESTDGDICIEYNTDNILRDHVCYKCSVNARVMPTQLLTDVCAYFYNYLVNVDMSDAYGVRHLKVLKTADEELFIFTNNKLTTYINCVMYTLGTHLLI